MARETIDRPSIITREYGSFEAAAYAASRHGPDGARFMDQHISDFLEASRGGKLLDVGGGAAKVGIEAVKQHGVLTVVDLDNSPAMLRQAEKVILDEGLTDQISTLLGSVEALPYKDGSCRRLTSVNVGCNLSNELLAAHFQEMARVVSTDGMILFTAPINLGELFTSGSTSWREQLFDVLRHTNEELKQGAENVQEIIQRNLADVDDIHRATFVVHNNQLRLVADHPEKLPAILKPFAISSDDIQEGQAIWRKLPGLVVPNNWHTQATYERLMNEAGLVRVEKYTDSFADYATRDEYNRGVDEQKRKLGPEYVEKGPFAVYILGRKLTINLAQILFQSLNPNLKAVFTLSQLPEIL